MTSDRPKTSCALCLGDSASSSDPLCLPHAAWTSAVLREALGDRLFETIYAAEFAALSKKD